MISQEENWGFGVEKWSVRKGRGHSVDGSPLEVKQKRRFSFLPAIVVMGKREEAQTEVTLEASAKLETGVSKCL